MKNKILVTLTLLLFLSGKMNMGNLYAQSFTPDVIGSAGTFATSANASMAWTIGEVMTETYSSANNFFTQGFHQPQPTTCTVISVVNLATETISLYPNPVIDDLIIDFAGVPGDHLIYMYDIRGQMLLKESIPGNQPQLKISFGEFANGVYLLSIINTESKTRSSYKINKSE